MPHRYLWRKSRDFVIYRILHVDDSPHRIALGVAIAFFIAWTPTMGFQMLLTFTVASCLRANRFVGLPIVWITNPITAVPMYYLDWLVGRAAIGSNLHAASAKAALHRTLSASGGLFNMLRHVFDLQFWQSLGSHLLAVGVELWIGSVLIGSVLAFGSYWLTRWAVQRYRAARGVSSRAEVVAASVPNEPSATRGRPA